MIFAFGLDFVLNLLTKNAKFEFGTTREPGIGTIIAAAAAGFRKPTMLVGRVIDVCVVADAVSRAVFAISAVA
jgi:hypothetical protein